MKIPLEKSLKKRLHVETGMLQDEVVEIAYALDNRLVLHGGTAIWRCFCGNRFSEDLDFYCDGLERISAGIGPALKARGLFLSKFKTTKNLIFAKVSDGKTEVRLEVNFARKCARDVRRYEKMDGAGMDVFCLPPKELVLEKISAYENRRLVRDLYDVLFLCGQVGVDKEVARALSRLRSECKKPLDGAGLSSIVYSGAVPTFEQMLVALKRLSP